MGHYMHSPLDRHLLHYCHSYGNYISVNKIKLSGGAVKAAPTSYTVELITGGRYWDGTESPIHMTLIGETGSSLSLGQLGGNSAPLQSGSTSSFSFDLTWDLGAVKCIQLTAMGHDAWMVDYVDIISSAMVQPYLFINADHVWLSVDTSEGSERLELCNPVIINTWNTPPPML